MVRKALQVGVLSVLAGLFLAVLPVYAASVDDAQYVADIVVENTGSSATNVCTTCDINTDALIDDGYATSDLLNTALQAPGGTDIAYMPGVGDDPWIIFVPTIAASEQKSYLFYTGGPAMQDNLMYFPNTGGMTSDDAASLELGDNFEVEQKCYFDTSAGSNKNLVYKEDAFRIWVSGEEEVSALFYTTGTDSETLRPNAIGDETSISYCTETYHWQAVDEEVADDDTTQVYESSTTYKRDLYDLPNSSIPDGSTINHIKIYFRCKYNAGQGYAKPSLKSDSTVTDGTEVTLTTGWVTYSQQWDTNPADGQPWEKADIDALQIGVSLHRTGTSGAARCTQVYVEISYEAIEEGETITATGVSSGEHTVKVTADETNFKIFIDGVEKDSAALAGGSVTDNDNDWSFLTNGSATYMDYHKITVSGTLKQHIVYERDTTFSDQSGNNNDTTPTFITESTDPDVSATMSNFRPIDEAELTGYTTEETPEILPESPDMPTEMYEEGETEHLPGAALINNLLDVGGIPYDLFWIPLCFGLAAGSAVLAYRWVKSLLIISIIGGVVMLFFSLTGVIPFWPFLIYGVIAGGLLVAEKHLSW